ncbi:transglutaminase domain-containing protein [Methanobrevibacter sp.]|uniref:transglutaminase domain-containing protein n=1 Tax=Methanobrevibacter sp. TaxID=66852 RepID=UPI00386FE19E
MIFIVLMVFLAIGAVNAAESINVSDTEDSNYLIGDDVDSSSANKLEISNEVSISETNIVNSHDDNLGNCPDEGVLNISSDYEDNYQDQLTSNDADAAGENTLCSTSSSTDSVVSEASSNNIVSADGSSIIAASKVSTTLSVVNAHYGKSSTIFDVTLKDNNGNLLANQKVILKVNKKSYSGFTNDKGIASIKTDSLKVGSYTLALSYGGNSNYSSSSLSKKVKVLSSAIGSDLTKYYGFASKYQIKFWKDNKALSNTKVSFKVAGRTYTATTNEKGVATVYLNLFVGKHTLTATNPYSKETVSYKITVKKDKTEFTAKAKTYIHAKKKGSFKVVLKSKHDTLLKNKEVTFTYNNKKVTSKTNANGEATITIPVLAEGTYKISFKYGGSDNYYASEGSAKIVVAKPTTMLSSKILVMTYNDGSKFKVKLTDNKGNALANKEVKFKINGKTTVCKTNSKGNAKLSLKNVLPGNHIVKYSHSSYGSKDYSHGSNRVIILKIVAKLSAKDLTMKANDNSTFNVKVKDASGKLLKNVSVKSVINGGNARVYKTDSNGTAKLVITKGIGYYTIKTIVSDPFYKSAPITQKITVKGTKLVAKDLHVMNGNSVTYSVKVVNEKNNPVKDKKVVFTFKGKNLTSKTNSKGIAKVSLGELSKGTHKINIVQGDNEKSAKIFVANKVSIKNILTAAKTVKNYITKHHKLPSSVKMGSISLKTADYLYLASKAVVNLKADNKKAVSIKILKNPSSPKSAKDLGYLRNYLGVAKSIVKTAESKGKMPNSVSSDIGSMGYDAAVYTVSDALKYYGKHKKMPAYVLVKSFSGSSTSYTGVLNNKNKITNLIDYLKATQNCEVNNAKIKKLVKKLTKDCKNDKEKATVIFNYVRDTISYSFYYNTRFGAVGTLNSGTGNCVDHAHALVAMFRAAGLPARYVHGTCTFSSGGVYGHVWSQVLIGDTWVVADAVSTRNSFGKVVNWNTHSYALHGHFRSLSF